MPTLRQRAVSRTPSGNPVWRELEDLPLRYRAMPADDQARATERAALREAIYRQMAGTMVRHVLGQAMAAEMAASAGGEASDAGFVAQVDRLFDTASAAQAQAQAPVRDKVQLLRSDSPLELIFRAEAKRLAGQHGDGLARAYGGATNLAADAQQGLVVDRSLNRRTTLLNGCAPILDCQSGSDSSCTCNPDRVADVHISGVHRECVHCVGNVKFPCVYGVGCGQ